MTWRSWISLLTELWWLGLGLTLLVIGAIMVADAFRLIRREFRGWRARLEIKNATTRPTRCGHPNSIATITGLPDGTTTYVSRCGVCGEVFQQSIELTRRLELDGLATAQDKRARRIH